MQVVFVLHKVFPKAECLHHQVAEVLGYVGLQAVVLYNLVDPFSHDQFDVRDAVLVTEDEADPAARVTLFFQVNDDFLDCFHVGI